MKLCPQDQLDYLIYIGNLLGFSSYYNNQLEESYSYFLEALSWCEAFALQMQNSLISKEGFVWTYNNLGYVAFKLDKFKEAYKYFDRALSLYRVMPQAGENKFEFAFTLSNIGYVAWQLNQVEQAKSFFRELLQVYKSLMEKEPNLKKDIALVHDILLDLDSSNIYTAKKLTSKMHVLKHKELIEVLENPMVYQSIFGKYDGDYSLGITKDPNNPNNYVLQVQIEGNDDLVIPKSIDFEGTTIPILVETGYTTPTAGPLEISYPSIPNSKKQNSHHPLPKTKEPKNMSKQKEKAIQNLEAAALTLFDADPRIDAVGVSQQGTYYAIRNTSRVVAQVVKDIPEVEGIPVVIAEVGEDIKPLTEVTYIAPTAPQHIELAPEQQQQRPLFCGLQIQNFDHDLRTRKERLLKGYLNVGTLGCFVELVDGSIALLSNNHVIAGNNKAKIGDRIFQAGNIYDESDEIIASLQNFTPLQFFSDSDIKKGSTKRNTVDAAVAKLNSDVDWSNRYLKRHNLRGLHNTADIDAGDKVFKVGRTTGYTEGYY